MTINLVDFVKTKKPKPLSCWLCNIPQREEIEKAKTEQSVSSTIIREWLINEHKYTKDVATITRIDYHFKRGHHEKPA